MPHFDLKAHEERMKAKIQQRTQPLPDERLASFPLGVAEKIKQVARRWKGSQA